MAEYSDEYTNMKKPKELTSWDFGDTIQIPDGCYSKSIPDITRDNFQTLIDEHNNLVQVVNMLLDEHEIMIIEEQS